MNYILNENNFIIKDPNKQLGELILTWEYNDYQCYKYKFENNKVIENEIVFVAMTDSIRLESIYEDGEVVDAATVDILSIEDQKNIAKLRFAQVKELKDEFGQPKFIKQGTKIKAKKKVYDTKEKEGIKEKKTGKRIAGEISVEYDLATEMAILKNYVEWIAAGQPANDKREVEYLDMQKQIQGIKKKVKK